MFTPHDFQQDAINSIFEFFVKHKGKGNPLVVAPTGSGKSVIIACFCQQVVARWKNERILVLSHVKEILEQNHKAIKRQFPDEEIGLYSAGLKSKTIKRVTVAGIQSIFKKPELFDQFTIVLVDESHSISYKKGSRYQAFFKQVKVPVVGFTATPFRMGTGYLHLGDDVFFSDIAYTIPVPFLQDKGYLCRLTTKLPKTVMNTDGIKKQGGDFVIGELSKAFDRELITREIIEELVKFKDIRKKWLIFAIDIKHAENIADMLNEYGVKTAAVHSKMDGNRDTIIQDYKEDKYQCLVSVAVLTTGFDVPAIDLIAMLRPTQSPALHVQCLGRGLRVSPEKEDCIVLDHGGNLFRNGPINAPIVRLKGTGKGEPIMKACETCFEIVHAAVRVCPQCQTEFKFRHHLTNKPRERDVVIIEDWHDVSDVKYFCHTGSKGIPMLRVVYQCGARSFSEYICFEHGGYATHKAHHWWHRRVINDIPPPETSQQASEMTKHLRRPKKILVNESGQYNQIKDQEF